jgi:hypothetical protein
MGFPDVLVRINFEDDIRKLWKGIARLVQAGKMKARHVLEFLCTQSRNVGICFKKEVNADSVIPVFSCNDVSDAVQWHTMHVAPLCYDVVCCFHAFVVF